MPEKKVVRFAQSGPSSGEVLELEQPRIDLVLAGLAFRRSGNGEDFTSMCAYALLPPPESLTHTPLAHHFIKHAYDTAQGAESRPRPIRILGKECEISRIRPQRRSAPRARRDHTVEDE